MRAREERNGQKFSFFPRKKKTRRMTSSPGTVFNFGGFLEPKSRYLPTTPESTIASLEGRSKDRPLHGGSEEPLLLADDDDGKGAGLHFAAALAGGWRFEFGAGEKNFVRFQVEAQGAGGLFCGDIFDDGEFVGRVFVDDGQIAVSAGDEE